MAHWSESKIFNRILEILPGLAAWTYLLMPFILAPTFPTAIAYFILTFNLYWFLKAINLSRHLVRGFVRMWRNMKIDWLERCKEVSTNPNQLCEKLRLNYEESKDKLDYLDYEELKNLKHHYEKIKNWQEVLHVIFITNFRENFDIAAPTYQAILDSNFPSDKIIIVSCGEQRDEKNYLIVKDQLQKEFGGKFNDILFYLHEDKIGEVKGKGSNLYSAAHKFMRYLKIERTDINPENVIVTNLDADHIINSQYLARVTYKYIIDPNRDHKIYQPVPVLFNNIWDAPALNRITAVASSLWQMIEAMRPYRLRTFAAHAQPLMTLIKTDFWSNKTIVEDGHQYWRTYFALEGNLQMVPLLVPVYQDCVLAESYLLTFLNQYKQRRRWAWGISDFPFVIKNFIRHKEIRIWDKFLQTFRLVAGHFSWATASFLIAFAWIPLVFNNQFQDTVLAHNVTYYSSLLARLAWVGIFANMWIYFALLPPKPNHHSKFRYIGMTLQWILSPVMAIFLSSLPAMEAQTRLMIGKYLDYFWSTPKIRKSDIVTKELNKKPKEV